MNVLFLLKKKLITNENEIQFCCIFHLIQIFNLNILTKTIYMYAYINFR